MEVIDGIATLVFLTSGFFTLSDIKEVAIKSCVVFAITAIYLIFRICYCAKQERRKEEFELRREYRRIAEREVRKLGKL